MWPRHANLLARVRIPAGPYPTVPEASAHVDLFSFPIHALGFMGIQGYIY